MKANGVAPQLGNLEPTREEFAQAVRAGLSGFPRTLPCRFLYDRRGSQLFDRICQLPEYYPTRTELQILDRHIGEIAAFAGAGCLLAELGSGSSVKTRLLLDHLDQPAAYVPIDISRSHLEHSAAALQRDYPSLDVRPLCADYTQPLILPRSAKHRRTTLFFPGSTIGNFERDEAADFLEHIAGWCRPGDRLIVGVDLVKDARILEAAYNDRAGITAAFNLNLLARANRELGTDFNVGHFRHQAIYDSFHQRIEMRLISTCDQSVQLEGEEFNFAAGEFIHTEYSHKYRPEDFAHLAAEGGWAEHACWMDPQRWFAVFGLEL